MAEHFDPGHDKYGHCAKCGLDMLVDRVVDGRTITMFGPKKTSYTFLLNDKSLMRVSMCKSCKQKLEDSDHEVIMDRVYKGWEAESKQLVTQRHKNKATGQEWDEKRREKYLDRMKSLEIITKVDGLSDSVIEKRFKKYEQDVEVKKPKKAKKKKDK